MSRNVNEWTIVNETILLAYNGNESDVFIPEGITNIEGRCFANNQHIQTVHFPNSLSGVGAYSFENCTNLQTVHLNSGCRGIGDLAFKGCTSLTSITLNQKMQRIGEKAFAGCINLTKVKVPIFSQLQEIGYNAFKDIPWNPPIYIGYVYYGHCPVSTTVKLKSNTRGIAGGAFEGTQIKHLQMPKECYWIGKRAFANSTLETLVSTADYLSIDDEVALGTPLYRIDITNEAYSLLSTDEKDSLFEKKPAPVY